MMGGHQAQLEGGSGGGEVPSSSKMRGRRRGGLDRSGREDRIFFPGDDMKEDGKDGGNGGRKRKGCREGGDRERKCERTRGSQSTAESSRPLPYNAGY